MSLSKSVNSQLLSARTLLNDELTRLASYVNWPSAAEVWPSTLSRNGFAYEGHGYATRCVACGVVVDNWHRGDHPQHVHRTRSPRCPFVVADGSGGRDEDDAASTLQRLRLNEPQASFLTDGETLGDSSSPSASGPPPTHTASSSTAAVDRSGPDWVRLRSERARLSTFDHWTWSSVVEPGELAGAGLFYTGHADRVQCAFCRGCLRGWRPGDRPQQLHRRHFPHCPLVTGNIPSDNSTTDSQSVSNQSQQSLFTAGELLAGSSVTVDGSVSAGPGTSSTAVARDADAAPAASSTAAASAASTVIEMEGEDCEAELAENRRLREARTCTVCMDREVNTVFLPCGHLVCCDTCSPELRHCAVCRALIRGTVKVFLG